MPITGYMESSLATSEIFQDINNISGKNKTTDKAINLIKNAKHLTNEDIEAAYISVKQVTDSLTRAAMAAFDNETLVLIYNNVPALAVTQTLPFITFKMKGVYKTYIFVDKYVSVSRNGVMTMQPSILRDLLIGALISNCIRSDYSKLASNPYLQKVLMELYTKFVIRILNREFAIQADKVAFDTLQYWINRFFLTRIFGASDTAENINTMASAHFRYVDELTAADIKQKYDNEDPGKFSELLNLLKTASPRMRTLNRGTFTSDWISYYYIPSMLAIDNVEYLIFMVLTLQSGNNIISIAASDIVKECKNIKGLREELLKLI